MRRPCFAPCSWGLGLYEPRLLGRRGQYGPLCAQSSGHGRADRLGRRQPHRLPPGGAARREPAKPLRAASSVLHRRGRVLSLRGDDLRGAHPLFDRGDSRLAGADALDPSALRRAGAAVAACPHRGSHPGLPPFHPPVPLLRAGHALHALPAGGLVLDGLDKAIPVSGPGGRRALHGRSLVCQLSQRRLGPGHASRFFSRRPLPHPAERDFPRRRPGRVARPAASISGLPRARRQPSLRRRASSRASTASRRSLPSTWSAWAPSSSCP